MTDHQRRALLRRHEHQTRRCGCCRRHTPRTPLPRPIMAADLGPNVSAAAAAACMSPGGRVWWWAVSRSRTPTTRCRAGAYATGITPGVCVRALDVRGRGCAGNGLLQRRDDQRKRTHETRQDQPNDKDPWAWVSADTVSGVRPKGPSNRAAVVITAINRHRLLWANG